MRGLVLVVVIVAAASSAAIAVGSSGTIIFSDDFSNPHSGWDVSSDKTSVTSYKDGQYWIRIKKPQGDVVVGNDLKKVVPAADMQIDATEHKGRNWDAVFLVCYTNIDSDVGYYFAVEPSRHAYVIFRNKGDVPKPLMQGFAPQAIHGIGAPNHLAARCIGARHGHPATLTLSVNRRFVAQARDPRGLGSFAGIGIDLYSEHGGSVASFDNALVREH